MSKQEHQRPSQGLREQQRPTSSLAIPIVVAGVVLAIIVGVILSIERGRPAAAVLPGSSASQGNTAQPLNTSSIPFPDVPRATLQETQSKLERGQAVLIDVRSKSAYDQGHAAGAISIPEEEMAARLGELPRDKEIILYCTWGQEQQSARVAHDLISRGFDNVQALLGGFAAWERAGLTLETTTP